MAIAIPLIVASRASAVCDVYSARRRQLASGAFGAEPDLGSCRRRRCGVRCAPQPRWRGGVSAVNVAKECVPSGGAETHGQWWQFLDGRNSGSTSTPISQQTQNALKHAGTDGPSPSNLVKGCGRRACSSRLTPGGLLTAVGSAFDLGSGPTVVLIVLAARQSSCSASGFRVAATAQLARHTFEDRLERTAIASRSKTVPHRSVLGVSSPADPRRRARRPLRSVPRLWEERSPRRRCAHDPCGEVLLGYRKSSYRAAEVREHLRGRRHPRPARAVRRGHPRRPGLRADGRMAGRASLSAGCRPPAPPVRSPSDTTTTSLSVPRDHRASSAATRDRGKPRVPGRGRRSGCRARARATVAVAR
jgi:hypothetical protein